MLGNCPECGSAVRATILAIVDPLAEELRPIARPRLVAAGLVVWTLASLVAALTCWVATGVALVYGKQGLGAPPWLVQRAPEFVAAELWIAGLGALLLCHPHRSVGGAANVLLAVLGALAYVPLGLVVRKLSEQSIGLAELGRLDLWHPAPDRTILRVGACALTVVIIAAIRPVARVLVARCLALRTGRVDRQTMLAVGSAAAMIICGDLLGWYAREAISGGGTTSAAMEERAALLRMIATVVMMLGAGLLTMGIAGMLVDAVRIAAAVLAPSPSLRQVLGQGGGGTAEGADREAGRAVNGATPSGGGSPATPPPTEGGGQ